MLDARLGDELAKNRPKEAQYLALLSLFNRSGVGGVLWLETCVPKTFPIELQPFKAEFLEHWQGVQVVSAVSLWLIHHFSPPAENDHPSTLVERILKLAPPTNDTLFQFAGHSFKEVTRLLAKPHGFASGVHLSAFADRLDEAGIHPEAALVATLSLLSRHPPGPKSQVQLLKLVQNEFPKEFPKEWSHLLPDLLMNFPELPYTLPYPPPDPVQNVADQTPPNWPEYNHAHSLQRVAQVESLPESFDLNPTASYKGDEAYAPLAQQPFQVKDLEQLHQEMLVPPHFRYEPHGYVPLTYEQELALERAEAFRLQILSKYGTLPQQTDLHAYWAGLNPGSAGSLHPTQSYFRPAIPSHNARYFDEQISSTLPHVIPADDESSYDSSKNLNTPTTSKFRCRCLSSGRMTTREPLPRNRRVTTGIERCILRLRLEKLAQGQLS